MKSFLTGKLLVVASVAGICGLLVLRYHPNVQFLAVPVGTVAVFAYLIAHCFLSVYEMVIDTLLLCFCEDSRVNNGKPGKEYFMSKSLMVCFCTILAIFCFVDTPHITHVFDARCTSLIARCY